MGEIITITVRDRIAENINKSSYVCGNNNYKVYFDFDDEWDGIEIKTARFTKYDGTYRDVVFQGNHCNMPVFMNTFGIFVGVYAGDLKTKSSACINAKNPIPWSVNTPEAPSEDVYAQIMEILNQTGKEAIDAAETAKKEAERAKDYADNAETAIEASKTSAIQDINTSSAEKLSNIIEEGAKQTAAAKAQAEAAANSALKAADMIQDNAVLTDKAWSSRNIVDRLCPPFSEGGAIITCHPVKDYPLHVVSHIEPVQAGTGDPSPNNIRHIVGWNSVMVNRCGKNMLPTYLTNKTYDKGSTIKVNDDGSITIHKVAGDVISERYFSELPAGTYTKSGAGTASFGVYLEVSGQEDSSFGLYSDGTKINPINQKVRYNLYSRYTDVVDVTLKPQLELGDIATAYEPYRGDVYSAELTDIVYGGILVWKTGVLTVTHSEIGSYSGEELPGKWISDRDVYAPGTSPTMGAQVVYELSQPYTIQLTPRQISALAGPNIIYSDTGDTDISGRSDPVHEIETLKNAIVAMGGTL